MPSFPEQSWLGQYIIASRFARACKPGSDNHRIATSHLKQLLKQGAACVAAFDSIQQVKEQIKRIKRK
jgi:hypothetical protein